ncbi:head-tail adaptor protein [Leisingera sp. HS039]|uniref:head-tail adaptor protein n=1 Tax=unclassified Leisingera TaxID=2614906 RepID=UPI0010706C51|nr:MULTISPECIES: head-tail adaptor protein [unclassified Leisingera]MBQ4823395.1 head-tail adaptor protein [Leisingera sp. HS039]MCF6432079.1 head-tail adaptor protein [Leisingera sp. MMG026]QBR36493.1 head-tail adaptor protein [Leisingera sp. NJS201]
MKNPPKLTRKLVLEDPQRSSDGAGGYTEDWVALGTLWAEVKSLSGRLSGDSLSLQKYRITLRASPEGFASRPRPDQRFRDSNRIYRIDAIAESDPDARYLTCFAVEEVSG